MTGRTLIPTATDVILSIGSGVRQQVSASVLNSYRMAAVSERLTSFVKSGQARDPVEFYNLLLSLSRYFLSLNVSYEPYVSLFGFDFGFYSVN